MDKMQGYEISMTTEDPSPSKLQENLQADIVKARFLELLELVQGQMESKHSGEQQIMLAAGMGMLITGVQGQDSVKLSVWLNSLEKTLLAVGRWDLPQETYENEVEQHLLTLLSIL